MKTQFVLGLFGVLAYFGMLVTAQYTVYNPYATQSPIFSNLNAYAYTTPYAGYGQDNMRIWPYVISQYGYPYSYYYNTNGVSYNPYWNGYQWISSGK